ncbi:E3 ubiquitin-protein ligase PUB23-like [Aristolochia californica]|uniref:E3 ubiquitin-protein ligase PUB23-like n=1 Tax=Aristolochia californica TaxID=171875 RepID=UPI0035D80DA9
MDEIEIPHYFLCPISLEMMRDPVTVCTGITYDRESIERWMFSCNNKTCPVTKQPLQEDLTPNHTVRRLIQAWCIANASYGVERIPTPRPPVDKTKIIKLIDEGKNPQKLLSSLHQLKSISLESDRNKRCMEAAGAVSFLASIVKKNSSTSNGEAPNDELETVRSSEEALSILHYLQLTDDGLRELIYKNGDFVSSLTDILRRGNCQSRAYAIFLLKSIFQVFDPLKLVGTSPEIFQEVVQVLRHQISQQATKSALQILIELCPWGRNRIKAVESGAVSVLIELLLEISDKRCCEMILVVLDQLCGCADGRADFLRHAAGLAIVSKKMLRVSSVATERAVKILSSISRCSTTPAVVQEMLQVGVVSKLCLVVQVNCSLKAREKAKEILALHYKTWRNSSCGPVHLLASYPSL